MIDRHRAVLTGTLLLAAALGGPALAQPAAECSVEEGAGAMADGTYRAVELAIEDMTNERFAEAEDRLHRLTDRARGYERAVIFQTLGFVYAQQESLGPALEAFEEALALGALPRKPQEELTFNVGQLYVANEQYERGIETLERYVQMPCVSPPAESYLLLATAYAQTDQHREALNHVNTAIELAEKPQEQWLQLKLALHYELQELTACAQTLVELIAIAPDNAQYWKQLSGVLLETEQQEDSLAVLAVAERQGLLRDERDLKNLAGVYLLLEIPFKAGDLVARGFEQGLVAATADNYEYLADAWIAAREWDRAEAALRRAAESNADGELWKRLAQVLMEKGDWASSEDALEQALLAGVADPGEANFLLGIVRFEAGDSAGAQEALRVAANHPATQQQARQWLEHVAANSR